MSTDRDDGLDLLREMLPEMLDGQTGDELHMDGFAGELAELSLQNVFGRLWTRPGLDRRSRSLVTLGILIALRANEELAFHFPIALRNGLTSAELEEVVYHATAYAGFPAASAARLVAMRSLGDDSTS
ncbi:carboxymuconolactone decarboxylase family protein [Saccharopolyspora sp. K220]|uniref:carboxymuconolactone decarboxylase family protein n=1 Tax=Saccharopolyspora soli TaxID=2926618 RepID=UPI001F59B373|nr:carboxymuconolactone decarboxylase family protein [Saccharopolyspora soli]MCI2421326.1 carboxymuconolactone decarboxylase family protein [Saccharopolyspora soli]